MKTKLIADLEKAFAAEANPEAAQPMAAYMKHQFLFYGLKMPIRNAIIQPIIKEGMPGTEQDLSRTILHMWDRDEREWKYTAILLAQKGKPLWGRQMLQVFEAMLLKQSWWDTVDAIASNLVSEWFVKFPDARYKALKDWEASGNMWLIRVCIIHQLKYKRSTDTVYLSGIIERHAHSKEFFIQKAIGWALRQYAKTDPEWVRQFINVHKLKPLSVREALKNSS